MKAAQDWQPAESTGTVLSSAKKYKMDYYSLNERDYIQPQTFKDEYLQCASLQLYSAVILTRIKWHIGIKV